MPVLKLAILGPEAVLFPSAGASIGALGLLLELEIDVDADGLVGVFVDVLMCDDAAFAPCASCAAAIAFS